MSIFILQDNLQSISNTPRKLIGKCFFPLDSDLSFFEKMLSEFNYFLFLHHEIEPIDREEVLSNITKSSIHVISFSFYIKASKQEYLTLCFENNCILFDTKLEESLTFMKEIFHELTKRKISLLSSNNSDYQLFELLINKLNEKSQTNFIQLSNISIPSNKEKREICLEINELISHINYNILQFPIFNIIKQSILTFMVRRFYYKSKFFSNPNFLNYNDSIDIKLQEFHNNDFITLREITLNILLVLYKKNNQLFVQKILKNRITFDSFQENEKIYHHINKLKRFVKFFGYTKSKQNEVDSLIIEFMSNGTIQEYFTNDSNRMNEQKFKVLIQIIDEINILHSNNIIHRDLKPDNIFINNNYKILIGDFDYSRFDSKSIDEYYTMDIGSFGYSSPELLNSHIYSKSTDIYSFGKIFYFVLFGEIPNQNIKEITNRFLKTIFIECTNINQNKRLTIPHIACYFILFSIEQYINNEFNYLFYLLKKDFPSINNATIAIFNKAYKDISIPDIELDYLFVILINLLPYHITNQKINIILDYLISLSNKRNNYKAQNTLGYIYLYSLHVPYDIDKSIYYYSLSANQNNNTAQNMLGMIYYSKSYPFDINKAIYYFTFAANQNNLNSIEILGIIYLKGIDVPQNINKAINYLTQAANKNSSRAQYILGYIYKIDEYVPHDTDKAIKYLTLAANKNNSDAYYELGMIYYFEKNDIIQTINYLTEAARRYNSKAEIMLGIIYINGDYAIRNVDKGIYYLTLAANRNNSQAQSYLGYIYNSNQYTKRNFNKAMYYFTLSSNQNDPLALFQLGMIYLLGKDIKRNINKAICYLTNSANQNESFAQYVLGYLYINGEYVSKDIKKGIYYLTYSANNGNQFAQDFLGKFYLSDSSLFDIDKAISFLILSANQLYIPSLLYLGYIYYSNNYVAAYNFKIVM